MNKIEIKAVGDICPGDKTVMGLGVLEKTFKNGVEYPFKNIQHKLKESDILIGNLEGTLSNRVKKEELRFCGLPDFAQQLRLTGFNVINVANNHSLEHGPEIFNETISYLIEANIHVCGLKSETSEYYSKPVIIICNGVKIGILGYNWVGKDKFKNADNYIAQSRDSIVNYTWNRDISSKTNTCISLYNRNVVTDIEKLSEKVDHIILVSHWGYEFINVPPLGVTVEAKSFIDAGVSIVLGGHSHTLQGYEEYKRKRIYYSLGNFIFDQRYKRTKHSMILEFSANKNEIYNYRMLPIKIDENFRPNIADEKDRKEIQRILYSSCCIINKKDETLIDDNILYASYEKHYKRLKLVNIIVHLTSVLKRPHITIQIIRKIRSLLNLVKARNKGKKIRW